MSLVCAQQSSLVLIPCFGAYIADGSAWVAVALTDLRGELLSSHLLPLTLGTAAIRLLFPSSCGVCHPPSPFLAFDVTAQMTALTTSLVAFAIQSNKFGAWWWRRRWRRWCGKWPSDVSRSHSLPDIYSCSQYRYLALEAVLSSKSHDVADVWRVVVSRLGFLTAQERDCTLSVCSGTGGGGGFDRPVVLDRTASQPASQPACSSRLLPPHFSLRLITPSPASPAPRLPTGRLFFAGWQEVVDTFPPPVLNKRVLTVTLAQAVLSDSIQGATPPVPLYTRPLSTAAPPSAYACVSHKRRSGV